MHSSAFTSCGLRVPADHRLHLFAWMVAAVLATGCEPAAAVRSGDIRSYTAPKPTAAPGGQPRSAVAAGPASSPLPSLRYEVPEGWADRGASGMRLATLVIGEPSAGQEVTVIPASGTLRSNVERWQKQLTAQADPAAVTRWVDEALAAAETIDVAGTKATVVMLSDDATAGSAGAGGTPQAILGAMIPIEDSVAIFVKYKGEAAVARQEKARFVKFVSSLRWK